MLAVVVAHGGGGEEVIGMALSLVAMGGGGVAIMLMQRRPAGSRRAQMIVLGAAVLLVAAATTLPSALHQCNDWRDRLLVATSGLISASGSGSDTPPRLTPQDHSDLQRRVSQVLDDRPFGCL